MRNWSFTSWVMLGLGMLALLVVLLLTWDFLLVTLIKSGSVEAP